MEDDIVFLDLAEPGSWRLPLDFFLTQEKYALASGENIFLPPFSEILYLFSQKALSRETQLFSTLRARFRAQGGLVAFRECPQSMQKPITDISIFFMPA